MKKKRIPSSTSVKVRSGAMEKQDATLVRIVIMICCAQGILSDCPRLCECKWKSGKESVLCLNANLSSVPLDLDAGTQVLDLTTNNLVSIKQDEFSKAGLVNLQKIFMAKCKLKHLDRYAFRHLINLVELDLSSNNLASIPSHVFESIHELRELKLSGNPIQRITNDAFIHLKQLVRLELSDCKIVMIESRGLNGLENSLEWLKIDNNRLIDVRSSTLTSLLSLHGLELAGNPWNCSCSLRPLREWMMKQNVPYDIPPVCKTPQRLASKPWDKLELDEFACVPKILAPDPRAHGVEGKNVTMTCRIDGVPEPSVRWMIKNRVIANLSGVPYANGKKLYVLHLHNNSSNLTILTADVQDAGIYVCAAENKAGRVEASVTLAVSRRPPERTLNNKAIVAAVIVATLFVLASCLIVLCVCSVKKRQQAGRWQQNRRTTNDDNYEKIEMNHKVTNNPQLGDVAVVGPIRRNGEYRGVPCLDTDQELDEEEDVGYEDNIETPTPTNPSRSADSKLWQAAATARNIGSPNNGHWNSNLGDSHLDPEDLHIPRRTKEETRDDCNKNRNSTFGTYKIGPNEPIAVTISGSLTQTLQPHLMRKQILGENAGSLYTTAPSPVTPDSERRFPDILKGPSNTNNYSDCAANNNNISGSVNNIEENLYCTLPRKKNYRSRYRSCDSQSPLLPESRYGSSGGEESNDSSERYPLSSNLNRGDRSNSYLNLVTTTRPCVQNSTPLLDISGLENKIRSPSNSTILTAVNTYDYHAAQLERFLEEYRSLQKQLSKMKETCDNIRQTEEPILSNSRFLDPLLRNNGAEETPKSILKKSSSPASCSSPMIVSPDFDKWSAKNNTMKRLSDTGFYKS